MATRKSKNHIEGQLSLESLWAEPEEVVATPSPSAATSPTGRHTNGANNRRTRRPRPARGAEARRTSSPLPGARSVILITRGPARREPVWAGCAARTQKPILPFESPVLCAYLG